MAEKTLKVSITRTTFACSLHFVKGFSFVAAFRQKANLSFPVKYTVYYLEMGIEQTSFCLFYMRM